MIECSLYSYINSIDEIKDHLKDYKNEVVECVEHVFANETSTVYVHDYDCELVITKKELLDKNKNRKYVACNVETSKLYSRDTFSYFLEEFGYKKIKNEKKKIFVFKKIKFCINVSRNITTNKEEPYIVKVFSLEDSLAKAEEIMDEEVINLENIFDLKKPDLMRPF